MIRIPSELIPPAPPVVAGKDVDEPAGVEQVGPAVAGGDASSGEPSANRPPSYQDVARARGDRVAGESADGRVLPPVADERAAGNPAGDASFPYERRQGDRRQQNRPVLLDTRVSRGRRQASGDGGINIKV